MAGFCPSVSTLNALLNSNRSLQNKQMSEHLKGKSGEIYSASRSTSVVITVVIAAAVVVDTSDH